MQLGGFSATNFRDLSKGVTAPQKDRDLLRAYLQRRPAVKRREGPGGFFDNHRDVGDQAEIAGCPQGRSCLEPLGKLGGFVCFPTRQPQPMSPHRGAALGPLGGFSLG